MRLAKRQRLVFVLVSLLMIGCAVAMMLNAMQDYVTYFYSPSDVVARPPQMGEEIRIGGLVQQGSVESLAPDKIGFIVTDGTHQVRVAYQGMIPNLFKEGQGVIATGTMAEGMVQAREILAKHDENYMPPEVAKALKKSGHWKEPNALGAKP
ncbi:MAG: cytochrome c maturation protein CcmE [Alphaproteobacteria bacterium]|nr:MAG: cytochrome c maturation protein CcmE [Alphaproteobacteria bacterium]